MSTIRNNQNSKNKYFMKLALYQAKKSLGKTLTNPSVGCVVVNDKNEIVSFGRTGNKGTPHAEYNALSKIKKNTSTSIYVTLEPCTHFGKTPPCTNIIIKKGIKKVFYSINDYDIITSNKAKIILKQKKIYYNNGLLKKNLKNFYKFYYKNKIKKLPYVTAKLAISKDYYIKNSKNKYITNFYSRRVSNFYRSINNGILISVKTLIDDNPILNCRINGLQKFSPVKIILDKNLSIPMKSNIVKYAKKQKVIIFHNSLNSKKITMLKKVKIKPIYLKLDKNNNFNLENILKILYKKNISRLLIEGGKSLTQSLLAKSLIDEFYLFKSNIDLKSNGKINVGNLVKLIKKVSKTSRIINTNLQGDRLINYRF